MLRWLSAAIDGQDRQQLEQAFAWIYTFVRPHGRAMFGLLVLSLLASALVLLQPWMTKLLIDDGLLAGDYNQLLIIAAVMATASLVGTVLAGVNRYLHTQLSGEILFALRENLYGHLQTLSPRFFGTRRTGDILSRLDGDVSQIQRFAVDSLFSGVSSVLGLLGSIILLVSLSWQLSLLMLVLIPFEILWLRVMRLKVEQQTRAIRERSASLSSFLVETLPAMKFIQSVSQEQREASKLRQLGDHYLRDLLKLRVTEFFTLAVPGALTSLTRTGAFLVGGYWVIEGQWPLGSLIAFSTYLGMATGPVQSLLGLYVAVQRVSVSLARVMELKQAEPDVSPCIDPLPLPKQLSGRISFRNVSFGFSDRQELILDQASIDLPAGIRIALTGASGVGKSTLIDLLMRHYDPLEGEIQIDGIDIRRVTPFALRQRIALVSQETTLFRGSLAENIRYAAPEASDIALQAVVDQAQLRELVHSLPEGLNTLIGERGVQLSGGQRQRLAIARALLQDPAILILDEATSAVDEVVEAQVIQQVDRLFADRTRIFISHRASTLSRMDLKVQLLAGKLLTSTLSPAYVRPCFTKPAASGGTSAVPTVVSLHA